MMVTKRHVDDRIYELGDKALVVVVDDDDDDNDGVDDDQAETAVTDNGVTAISGVRLSVDLNACQIRVILVGHCAKE